MKLSSMDNAIRFFSQIFNILGLCSLLFMMMMIVSDVLLRYALNHPLAGTIEVTEYMMVVIFYGGLAWCHLNKRNVKIDVSFLQPSPKLQGVFDSIGALLGVGIFALITWQGIVQVEQVWQFGKISDVLKIPAYPFYFILILGSGTFCFVLFLEFIDSLLGAFKT